VADRQLFDRPDAEHRFHDLLLVAALAAGDLDPGDLPRARSLVEGCAECAELATDLRAISTATATTPAPERTRDFRLTQADAQRLRPYGLQRVRAAFDGRRLQLARPLATGLTMLGLVGVVVTSLPSMSLGGASTGAASRQGDPSSVPSEEIFGGQPAATERVVVAGDASGAPDAASAGPAAASGAPPEDGGNAGDSASPLTLASGEAQPDPDATIAAVPGGGQPGPVDPPASTGTDFSASSDQLAPIRWISFVTLFVGLVLLGGSTLLVRARRDR
jgi:hypothetical protein